MTEKGKIDFARTFHDHVLTALMKEISTLFSLGVVAPGFTESYYKKKYLLELTVESRKPWLQSTLLGVAQSGSGAFGLFLGDGLLIVDRGPQNSVIRNLARDGRGPMNCVWTGLGDGDVLGALRHIPAPVDESAPFRIIVASDGVADTIDHKAPEADLGSNEKCTSYLVELAKRPSGVANDNMSIAMAARRSREK